MEFNLGFDVEYVDGIRVEIYSDWILAANPTLNRNLWNAGGAIALRLQVPVEGSLADDPHVSIVVAKELKERLGESGFKAVLEHELAHIKNGDLNNIPMSKAGKFKPVMVYELAADKAAAEKHGALVLAQALENVVSLQLEKLFGIRNPKINRLLKKILMPKMLRQRIRLLNQMA